MIEAGSQIDPDKVAIVIPTLNAGPHLDAQLAALSQQGLPPSCYLVIDSSSDDDTQERYAAFGADVVRIERREFNHGGTRRYATTLRPGAEFLVMMTQDAIPASPDSLRNLLASFGDPAVGMAYGRQLPRRNARGIERHARLLNYPPVSEVRSLADRPRLGVKTTFCSDSYAAYRRTALQAVGNFPEDTYFAEDQIVAGRMLLAGWKLAYQAEAGAVHSHGYSISEEFRRYFDIGVFHSRNQWLLVSFGAVEGEGVRFLKSEFAYLARHEPLAIASAFVRAFAKYAGYRLGRLETRLSPAMKKRLSMQPYYWGQKEAAAGARPTA
ncbi:MAG TPA: glycosyltransferase [Allosphingosinicella sp.]|nr:glycosyltransferase [Allosphingosinicella sp.]